VEVEVEGAPVQYTYIDFMGFPSPSLSFSLTDDEQRRNDAM
jgi:hypothetical protein